MYMYYVVTTSVVSANPGPALALGDTVYVAPNVDLVSNNGNSALFDSYWGSATIEGAIAGGSAVAAAFFDDEDSVGTTSIQIGITGSVTGLGFAAIAVGNVNTESSRNVSFADTSGYVVNNAGLIACSQGGDALLLNTGGDVSNSGTIQSDGSGIVNIDTTQTDTSIVYNYGNITGAVSGVYDAGGHAAKIYNYGAINGSGLSASSNFGAVYGDYQTTEALTNAGTIAGRVQLNGFASTIINSGTISGDVSSAGSQLDDTGTIDGDVSLSSNNNDLPESLLVDIGRAGVIRGDPDGTALTIASGPYAITNAGEIIATEDSRNAGPANGVSVDGEGQIVNRGSIDAATVAVLNNDTVSLDVSYLYNYGSIYGGVCAVYDTGNHQAVILNYGSITSPPEENGAAVYVSSTSPTTLVNSGSINGGVQFTAAGSSVTNSGSINGGVSLVGANSSLLNTDSISGGVNFNGGSINSKLGAITGAINVGANGGTVIAGQTGGTVVGGSGNDVFYANTTQAAANNAAKTALDGKTGNNWLYGDGAYTTFDSGDNAAGTYNQIFGVASEMANVAGYAANTVDYATISSVYRSAYVDLLHGDAYMCRIASANGAPAADLVFEDYLRNVPNVIGTSGSDVIICDNGVDRITHGSGAGDILYAGTGAASQDTFIYSNMNESSLAHHDIIEGFKAGVDKIDLSALNIPLADVLLSYGGNGVNTIYVEKNPTSGFQSATDMIISVQASTHVAMSYGDIIG